MSKPPLSNNFMEKLAILLSLPRQNTYNALPVVERPAGLPINALPGWETIPLHSKLPMLKCPDNQVIFSKNKIGRSFETSQQRDFDSVCLNSKMDYNPLHDPHLRRFYTNEKLLKRLRENGEITQDDDVICTLKEFNEHRIPLHETYLSIIRMERKRLNDEKRDLQMIRNAEYIAEREMKIREKREKGLLVNTSIQERKEVLAKKRAQWIQTMRMRNQHKEQQIENLMAIRQVIQRHKKEMHDFKIKHHLDVFLDIRRKRLIALKKHLQFKKDRLKSNMKKLKETAFTQGKEKARQSWEMHLKARIVKHEYIKQVTKENEKDMHDWIERHKARYRRKWAKIQKQLEERSRGRIRTRTSRRKRLLQKIEDSIEQSNDDKLKNLTSQDIRDALETAVNLQEQTDCVEYDTEDYIYKAAKYILEGILCKFNKDLSGEQFMSCILQCRISKLFTEVSQYALKRATQIIISGVVPPGGRISTASSASNKSKKPSLTKFVSFSNLSSLIGKGSYSLNSQIKLTVERTPTPTASLNSVVAGQIYGANDDGDGKEDRQQNQCTMERDEIIFVEHLFIKFKRQLLVGIGRRVLAAIECHRNNQILDVRQELLDIDRQFLAKVMTRSILSYAVNSANFNSNSLLCQHALAGDIVFFLQKDLLKPKRDPRVITQPRTRCACCVPPPFSKYCRHF